MKEVDEGLLFMASSKDDTKGGGIRLIDSECSNHMSRSKHLFHDLQEVPNKTIKLGDGKTLKVCGIGFILLRTNSGKIHTLTNIQFVPDLAHNLLSVGLLMSFGFMVEFSGGECVIRNGVMRAKVAQVCMTSHRLFPLKADDVRFANVAGEHEASDLWHRRFGHLNLRSLKLLSDKKIGIVLPAITTIESCEAYCLGKQTWQKFPVGQARKAQAPLELVHGDLVGPMKASTLGGNLYFILLTDD